MFEFRRKKRPPEVEPHDGPARFIYLASDFRGDPEKAKRAVGMAAELTVRFAPELGGPDVFRVVSPFSVDDVAWVIFHADRAGWILPSVSIEEHVGRSDSAMMAWGFAALIASSGLLVLGDDHSCSGSIRGNWRGVGTPWDSLGVLAETAVADRLGKPYAHAYLGLPDDAERRGSLRLRLEHYGLHRRRHDTDSYNWGYSSPTGVKFDAFAAAVGDYSRRSIS